MPKNFVGEPFSLSLVSGIKKKFFRGLCHDFPSKIFCLTVTKHSVDEPFSAVFQKISCSGKVYGKEGGGCIKISFGNFLSHSAENSRREPFSLSLISGIEKIWVRGRRGSVKIFRRKFLVSQCRKIS